MDTFGAFSVAFRNRQLQIFFVNRRWKSFRVKRKWATTERKQQPTYLALQHFDFFYRPLFGANWPSIRLGLLSDQKYVALVNNYAQFDKVVQKLERLGAEDALIHFRQIQKKSEEAPKFFGSDAENFQMKKVPEISGNLKNAENLLVELDEKEKEAKLFAEFEPSRDESGLQEFIPATKSRIRGGTETDTIFGEKLRNEFEASAKIDEKTLSLRAPLVPDSIQIPDYLKIMIFPRGNISVFPQAPPDLNGVVGYYLMDGASIFPVVALDIKNGDVVLDLCAAPGGKTLLMLQTLMPGGIICNEPDVGRMGRLRKTLNCYLPEGAEIRERVILKRKDATTGDWSAEYGYFDKVLVDAPCTVDRMALMDDDKNLFKRSSGRERLELPGIQTKLLVNGIKSLKPGGSLVYSTCSLSPIQNDNVVEAALKQIITLSNFELIVRDLSPLAAVFQNAGMLKFSSNCKYGQLILPHIASNFGPMYACKIQRVK